MNPKQLNALKNITDNCSVSVTQAKADRKKAVENFLLDMGIKAGQDIRVCGVAYMDDDTRREMLGLSASAELPPFKRGQWVRCRLDSVSFDRYEEYLVLCCTARKPSGELYQRGGDFKLKLSDMGDGRFWYVFGSVPRTQYGGSYAEVKAVE